MHAVFGLINHVAQTNAIVLIEGDRHGQGSREAIRRVVSRTGDDRGELRAAREALLERSCLGMKGALRGGRSARAARNGQRRDVVSDEVGVPASMQRLLRAQRRSSGWAARSIEVDVAHRRPTARYGGLSRRARFAGPLMVNVKIDLPPRGARDIPLLALISRKIAAGRTA